MQKLIQPLTLLFLGSPRILRFGEQATPDTRKATALMAYLAVTGRPQTRDTLSALLYPENDDAHARGALRRTLHALKSILPNQFLKISRDQIELNQNEKVWVDVVQFKRLVAEVKNHPHPSIDHCPVCHTKREEADKLYQGDFMAGFSLRDSPAFDDWQFFEREELRRDQAIVLQALARSSRSRLNFEKAIDYARSWLSLDPLVEDAHRELMRCYAAIGHRNAAIRQYQECIRILDKELGVPPLEETTLLYQEILDNRLVPPFQNQPPVIPELDSSSRDFQYNQPSMEGPSHLAVAGARFPLVGRSRESEEIVQAYLRYASDGYFFALEGETGIGKTRLAEEFLASIRFQGAVTIKSRCYEGESNLAYGPVVDALNGALSDPNLHNRLEKIPVRYLSEAARLMPALHELFSDLPLLEPFSGQGAQSLFYESLRLLLLQICSSKLPGQIPGVLFIDDLQWADNATLDFLAYLLRRIPGERFFFLAAWRNETHPNQDNLKSMLANVKRAGHGAVLELKRLNPKDVTELLRVAKDQYTDTPAGIDQLLYQETEGLPFFLVEYLDSILHSLARDGVKDLDPSVWAMPESVRDLLRTRIQRMDELRRQLLTTAAVIGRSFDFHTLTAASGRSEMETINGLESLISQGLIEECSSCDTQTTVEYDFTHDKLRSLVIEETSLIRRRLLHRRVAEALLQQKRLQPSPNPLDAKIAYHYSHSGQEHSAAEFFKLAGDHARSVYANRDAISHYKSAIESSYPEKEQLLESIGDLYTLLGEYKPALAAYHSVGAAQPQISHKIGRVYLREGNLPEAIENLKAAYERINATNDSILRARILADWSLSAYQNGQKELAQELAENALRSSAVIDDHTALNQVHNLLGILARSNGDYPRAMVELETSMAIAVSIHDESAEATSMNNLALVLSDIGELEKAIQLTKLALEINQRLGDRHRAAALHNNLADLLHQTGQEELAMEHLKQAVTIFAEIGNQTGELQPEIWKLTEW